VRGIRDGEPLVSILEHAEARGLATGIVTNDSLAGATPAALYARSNERDRTAAIFLQLFEPRYGDGVDVAIGAGRPSIAAALAAAGRDLDEVARGSGRSIFTRVEDVPAAASRAIVLHDSEEFDLAPAVDLALRMLSRAANGFFLMVESDVHTDRPRRGLDRMVAFDRIIRRTSGAVGGETLVMFTADHSFDFRVRGGPADALLEGVVGGVPEQSSKALDLPHIRMNDSHTGEEVLVAAQGPGADRVGGYMANRDLFAVMMRAYGWPLQPPPASR
jgi:alkaline phosphatase